MKKEENWWTNPENAEKVKELSWWDHPENQTFIKIPIAIIKDEDRYIASLSDDKNQYFGEHVHACVSAKSREEAEEKLLEMARFMVEFYRDRELSYQRWVPFRKGPWKSIGCKWFSIFGFHVYFRYGKGMKGGNYVPFTKLNITFSSDWSVYKKYKTKKNES